MVETSKDLTFGCWQVAYPELGTQFAAAGWSAAMTNHWAKVHPNSNPGPGPRPNPNPSSTPTHNPNP